MGRVLAAWRLACEMTRTTAALGAHAMRKAFPGARAARGYAQGLPGPRDATPLETAGFGAGRVGPGVATGASTSVGVGVGDG